jgi:hypothetical protein
MDAATRRIKNFDMGRALTPIPAIQLPALIEATHARDAILNRSASRSSPQVVQGRQ